MQPSALRAWKLRHLPLGVCVSRSMPCLYRGVGKAGKGSQWVDLSGFSSHPGFEPCKDSSQWRQWRRPDTKSVFWKKTQISLLKKKIKTETWGGERQRTGASGGQTTCAAARPWQRWGQIPLNAPICGVIISVSKSPGTTAIAQHNTSSLTGWRASVLAHCLRKIVEMH